MTNILQSNRLFGHTDAVITTDRGQFYDGDAAPLGNTIFVNADGYLVNSSGTQKSGIFVTESCIISIAKRGTPNLPYSQWKVAHTGQANNGIMYNGNNVAIWSADSPNPVRLTADLIGGLPAAANDGILQDGSNPPLTIFSANSAVNKSITDTARVIWNHRNELLYAPFGNAAKRDSWIMQSTRRTGSSIFTWSDPNVAITRSREVSWITPYGDIYVKIHLTFGQTGSYVSNDAQGFHQSLINYPAWISYSYSGWYGYNDPGCVANAIKGGLRPFVGEITTNPAVNCVWGNVVSGQADVHLLFEAFIGHAV